jgi:hypothetical protein
MADTTDNLSISIYGGDALLGSDVFTNNGETAHAQINKLAWGDENFTYKANSSTPLPVRIYGSSGDNRTVVTGGVFGLGSFTVQNTGGSPLYVATPTGGILGVSGTIQGISGGVLVGVTGSVKILENIGITGLVSITGGRNLTFGTDSIRVYGEVGTTRGWLLTSNDVVSVVPSGGGLTLATYIAGSGGTPIGSSGDALKVFVSNTSFTLTANISSEMGIKNATGDILRVQGQTWTSALSPTPVIVRGSKASSNLSSGIDDVDVVVSFDGPQEVIVTNSPTVDIIEKSFLYNYLHGGNSPGLTASVGVNISSIQASVNSLVNKLSSLVPTKGRNDTAQSSFMKNWFVTLVAGDPQPKLLGNPLGETSSPIQGTMIKNLTYLRTSSDPPPVTIAIGTIAQGSRGDIVLSMYLDPGESIFIPMSVSNVYAKIVDKSVATGFVNQTYSNALGIMSI